MRRTTVIVLLFVVLVAVAVVPAMFYRSTAVLAGLNSSVGQELSRVVGGTVSIGGIEVTSFHTIVLHDTIVTTEDGEELLTVPQALVDFSLWALLRGGSPAADINRIVLSQPTIHLRRLPDGAWNVSRLAQRRPPGTSDFRGQVLVEDGTAVVQDGLLALTFRALKGQADLRYNPVVTVNFTARQDGAAVAARGRVHTGDGSGVLRLTVQQGEMADYAALWPQDAPVRLEQGKFDLSVLVTKNSQGLQYAGEAAIRDGTATAAGLALPLTQLTGRFTFTQHSLITTGATAALGGQPLAVRGQITLDTTVPVFDVHITSRAFDPAAALPDLALPVAGCLAFNIHVTGAADRPAAQGEVRLPAGTVHGYAISDAQAAFTYKFPHLTVTSARFGLAGGTVTATGEADWQNGLTFTARVHVAGVNTGWFPALAEWGGPVVDAGLTVAGNGGDPRGWTVWGTASFGPGTYHAFSYQGGEMGFYWQDGRLDLDYLNLRAAGGTISARGDLGGDGSLSGTVTGTDLDLAALLSPWSNADAAGTARFQAVVSGTLAAPVVDGRLDATDGRLLRQPFATLTATMHATPGAIAITRADLRYGITSHTVSGSIVPGPDPALHLTVSTRRARAEDLAGWLAPGLDLTGNVDNDLTIAGTLASPVATGRLTLTEGSWYGHLVSRAAGTYHLEGRAITLDGWTVDTPGATFSLTGQGGTDGALNLAFTAQVDDLARLGLPLPGALSGTASLTGHVTGTLDAPVVDAAVSTPALTVNGQSVTAVEGQVQYRDNTVFLPYFRFRQGQGAYAVRASFGLGPDGPLAGEVAVEDGELAGLLPVLNLSVTDVNGTLNGRLTLSGTVANPTVAVVGRLTAGKVKGYPVEQVDLDVQLANKVITINTFTARQGAGVLVAKGTANLAGPLHMEVGAQNIDAGLVAALAGLPVSVSGRMNFAAQVSGVAASPYVAASAEVADGVIGNTAFDNLYGLVVLDHGIININQVLLRKGPYRASAYGTIPLAALSAAGRQQPLPGQTMNVKIRLDQADLSILPFLTPQVTWAAGETHGEVTIGGTLAEPVLGGSLTVPRGVVKLAQMAEPIQNVAVDIQLNDDKIVVRALDGAMGSGTFHLAGQIGLAGLAVHDYDLVLVLHDLGLSHKYFQGPVSGTLSLTGPASQPRLAGQITLARDVIDIPMAPPSGLALPPVDLDVEVTVGDRVRLYNPYMYDAMVSGRVRLAGSTLAPQFSGRITAQRGTVSYLHTRFRLIEGTAEFTPFGSWEPVLHVQAQTRLEQTTVNLHIDGPLSALQLSLSSDPPLRQQEILTLLTLRSRYFDSKAAGQPVHDTGLGRDEMLGLLDAGLQARFLTEMESVFRQAFGVDEFRLVKGRADETDFWSLAPEPVNRDVYSISVSKYVNDRLQLSYTQAVNYHSYTASFRYDLTRRLAVGGSLDEQNRRLVTLEARYKF